ncbi:MAG: hypothetical protein HY046_10785 [Acidobacteria bacterium]|nr:hypothetical protein [Acidobacteriota bacterium]
MPISKSLVQPFRKPMIVVGSGFRGFFAPFVQGASPAPTLFDPARQGRFDTNTLPTGWVDLGWIDQFRRSPAGRIGQIRSGYRGAVRAQYRGEIGSSVEFEFREWGKLQMALATGTTHFNILKAAAGAAQQPLGGSPTAAVGLGAGSNASSIVLTTGGGASFSVGQFVAVDVDYAGQAGYIGTGIQASYAAAGAISDVDFVRRVTFNIGSIKQITGDTLTLDQPLLGGVPTASAKVQVVTGFASREGSSFIPAWSAVSVMDTTDGAQLYYYYPQLSIASEHDDSTFDVENAGTAQIRGHALHGEFNALAYEDPVDGETVVCYRGFFPAPGSLAY